MVYLLLGENSEAKERALAGIKTKYLSGDSALAMDYEPLSGDDVSPETLKKALLALPALSRQRLVLIRAAEKLDSQNQAIILDFIKSGHAHLALVLDCAGSGGKSGFISRVKPAAETVNCARGGRKQTVFDVTRAMEGRDTAGALKVLNELISDGNHPLKIMGGIVWFWGDRKNRLSGGQFKEGLRALQEADLNIKRSRLEPAYAAEIVVTKLSAILNGKA